MEGGNRSRMGRTFRRRKKGCKKWPQVWRQTLVPNPNLGRFICFGTEHRDHTKPTHLYSIPFDNLKDYSPSLHRRKRRRGCGGGGEGAVGLKPFDTNTLPRTATFAAAGTSLFCIGGTEQDPNSPRYLKPTNSMYRFDTTDPERGWHAFEMLSPRKIRYAVAMDGKLYIMNGLNYSRQEHSGCPWAEIFDPLSETFLPLPLPPSLLFLPYGLVYVALQSSKRFLMVSGNVAYVYHVVDGDWKQLDHTIESKKGAVLLGDQLAVVRNTTLCWYDQDYVAHRLHAYDLDLKMWFKCGVTGLDKVGMLREDGDTSFSLLPWDDNHLCLLWMDHSSDRGNRLYGLLHCTKIQVSIKVGARGKPRLYALAVSSTSYVLDQGESLFGNNITFVYVGK